MKFIEKYDAYYIGNEQEKKIYLTFDCGYESGYMPAILDALKEADVKAAFFLVGNYLEKEPELVKRMVAEGHTIGNHTYHHKDMASLGVDEFKVELTTFEDKLKEITGEYSGMVYRPPQGKYSVKTLQMAKELGYRTVFWSLAYVDWNNDAQPTKEAAFAKLLPRTHNGAVILLHSTSKTNAAILDELLTKWENMGYRFASIDRLFS